MGLRGLLVTAKRSVGNKRISYSRVSSASQNTRVGVSYCGVASVEITQIGRSYNTGSGQVIMTLLEWWILSGMVFDNSINIESMLFRKYFECKQLALM